MITQIKCAIGNFYKQTQRYEELSKLHTHVHESERKVIPFDPERVVKTA